MILLEVGEAVAVGVFRGDAAEGAVGDARVSRRRVGPDFGPAEADRGLVGAPGGKPVAVVVAGVVVLLAVSLAAAGLLAGEVVRLGASEADGILSVGARGAGAVVTLGLLKVAEDQPEGWIGLSAGVFAVLAVLTVGPVLAVDAVGGIAAVEARQTVTTVVARAPGEGEGSNGGEDEEEQRDEGVLHFFLDVLSHWLGGLDRPNCNQMIRLYHILKYCQYSTRFRD